MNIIMAQKFNIPVVGFYEIVNRWNEKKQCNSVKAS